MATHRPLYSLIGEANTEGDFSNKQGGRISNQNVTSDVDLQNGTKSSCEGERASSRTNILASGKLFMLITKTTGLWNPREKRYALVCSFVAVSNILSLLTEILIPSICGPFVNGCVTYSSRVTNVTAGANNSQLMALLVKTVEETLVFDAWNALSDTVTYIILIYTLWRVQQQLPSLLLASAQAKVTSREWLLINVMLIICSVIVTVAVAFQISVIERSKTKFYSMYGSGLLIVYFTAFTCCCVFSVLTCALGSLADTCFQEICNMGDGNLNDVTAIHQKLCKQLSTASQSLRSWFVVHWVMFGMYCFAVFVFDYKHATFMSREFGGASNTFLVVAFILNVTIFLVPCVYASRVTWKCDDFLFKINNMSAEDWTEGHPFRERVNVNEFIFYAERSKCGFRIGKMTFGSSGTWISVLVSLLGLVVRLFTYLQ